METIMKEDKHQLGMMLHCIRVGTQIQKEGEHGNDLVNMSRRELTLFYIFPDIHGAKSYNM